MYLLILNRTVTCYPFVCLLHLFCTSPICTYRNPPKSPFVTMSTITTVYCIKLFELLQNMFLPWIPIVKTATTQTTGSRTYLCKRNKHTCYCNKTWLRCSLKRRTANTVGYGCMSISKLFSIIKFEY